MAKAESITIAVKHDKLGKFDVKSNVNMPSSIDEFVQQAGSEENALAFISSAATRVLKGRANSVWRAVPADKDLPADVTTDSISKKIIEALGGNAFVALRGTGDVAVGKAAIATLDSIKALKAKVESGEITMDEYFHQMSALV